MPFLIFYHSIRNLDACIPITKAEGLSGWDGRGDLLHNQKRRFANDNTREGIETNENVQGQNVQDDLQ